MITFTLSWTGVLCTVVFISSVIATGAAGPLAAAASLHGHGAGSAGHLHEQGHGFGGSSAIFFTIVAFLNSSLQPHGVGGFSTFPMMTFTGSFVAHGSTLHVGQHCSAFAAAAKRTNADATTTTNKRMVFR